MNLFTNENNKDKSTINYYDNLSKLKYTSVIPQIKENEIILSIGETPLNTKTGEILITFLNSDVTTFNGFFELILEIGLSGFYGISKNIKKFLDENYNPEKGNVFIPVDKENFNAMLEKAFKELKIKLINFKNDYCNMLDYCSNTLEKSYLQELTFIQRFYVGKKNFPNYKITTNINLIHNVFKNSHNLDLKSKVIDLMQDSAISEEELANKIKNQELYLSEVYKGNFFDILQIEFTKLCSINCNYISKCQSCGQYFIKHSRTDEIYCEGCKNTGYYNKLRQDIFKSAFRTAYNSKNQAKNRRGRTKTPDVKNILNNQYDEWVVKAKSKMIEAQKGYISLEEYKEWLNKPIKWEV